MGGTQIGLRHTGSCRLPNLKTDGVKQLLIQYSSKNPGGILQIRAGGIDGKIVLKVKLDSTSKGKLLTLKWPESMGRQDYYLEAFNGKLAGKSDDVFKIVWFALLPELNLSKNNFEEFLS